MKQNSSIVFHSTGHPLIIRYLRRLVSVVAFTCLANSAAPAERPEYLESFNPAKGFKPAQTDLTEVFLQLAGSLEYYGSPEPYLRHVAAEDQRIQALYKTKLGKEPASHCPRYLTDAYLDRFAANWKILAARFDLEPYAKEVGHIMRDAIKGTRGTGTIVVGMFNRHQERVFNAMTGKPADRSDFDSLKAELITELELDKEEVSESRYEVARRDAVSYAIIIHGITMKRFTKVDEALKPADAARVKNAIVGVFLDVGRMAQSELEAGLAEWALKPQTVAK